MSTNRRGRAQTGFSLLEMVVSTALLTVIMGSLFGIVYDAQRNNTGEQVKLDLFQEARQFMDQMSRDIRSAGYPNTLNYSSDQSPAMATDAAGLVYISTGDLLFEGSPDGSGTVYSIRYHLDTSTGNGCPCLRRSQVTKVNADPLAQATDYQTEVQNVVIDPNQPIFTVFHSTGPKIDLGSTGIDLLNNAADIADINTVAVKLTVQSPRPDPRTAQKPTLTLMTNVKLNNCSGALPPSGASVMGCH